MKKNNIILICCPPWGPIMPPLSVAYLSSFLRSKGIETEVYDLNIQLFRQANGDQRQFWDLSTLNKSSPEKITTDLFNSFEKTINEFIKELSSFKIIGLSANSVISTAFAGILAKKIKGAYDKLIIAGGPGCYHGYDRKSVPKGAVDFFVIGEGEEVIYEIIKIDNESQNGKNLLEKIPGVLNVNNRLEQKYHPPKYIKDLDALPHPTFEEFNLSYYNDGRLYDNGKTCSPLPILTSRGCINRCSYCIDWYMCGKFRTRSAQHTVSEIKYHIEKNGTKDIEFNDLLCNGSLMELERLCDLLIKEKIKINWTSYAAIRKDMNLNLLKKLSLTGCSSLCYGIESASNAVLKLMNKHYTRKEAQKIVEDTYKADILVRMNIIVGFPNETAEDFQQTLDFVYENRKYLRQITNISSFVLMPGSDLAVYPHRFGIRFLDPNDLLTWTDENNLTQKERNDRVRKACQLAEQLGIENLIVNTQKEDVGAQCIEKKDKILISELIEDDKDSNNLQLEIRTHRKKTNLHGFKIGILIGLFIFSVILDFYLLVIKKIRKSIIFPGN